jgi:hypothetical protein
MPADRRTPAELLAENDELARLLLLDVHGQMAQAMLRTFPFLVDGAARLWSMLPPASPGDGPSPDPMFRLLVIARGIDRGTARGLWPGDGLIDERLLTIARNSTRAAERINNSTQQKEPSLAPGGWADLADSRTQTMHVLYVTVHGITVGLAEHAAMVPEQLRRESLRKVPSQVRFDQGEPDAARAMISRLDVFEQIAGHFLFGTESGRAGKSATPSVTDPLSPARRTLPASPASKP